MNRAFARVAAICPLTAATTLLPAGAAGAEDLTGHAGNACSVVGTVASPTGLRYEPTGGSYVVDGVMDCTSKAFGHGTITGRGKGIVGCLGGTSAAVLDVAWRNGEHSELTMQTGDLTYGTGGYGIVTRGAMTGSHVGMAWGREAAGAEFACATDSVRSYEFAGGIGFHEG
ncbi:MAG TPA: hypothetical protein VHV82_15750 [Sporichthyaceae bacterium]|jgi:hypothetical protein|nr:hypothetical protein [Sporichthyaceae bacterium]